MRNHLRHSANAPQSRHSPLVNVMDKVAKLLQIQPETARATAARKALGESWAKAVCLAGMGVSDDPTRDMFDSFKKIETDEPVLVLSMDGQTSGNIGDAKIKLIEEEVVTIEKQDKKAVISGTYIKWQGIFVVYNDDTKTHSFYLG